MKEHINEMDTIEQKRRNKSPPSEKGKKLDVRIHFVLFSKKRSHLECCFSSLPVLLGRLRTTGPSTLTPLASNLYSRVEKLVEIVQINLVFVTFISICMPCHVSTTVLNISRRSFIRFPFDHLLLHLNCRFILIIAQHNFHIC